jgi:hypothetical protein
MMDQLTSIGDVYQIRETMQAAIAPAFLLNGIMAALAMLSVRLSRVLDRERSIRGGSPAFDGEQRGLARRAVAAHRAIFCCVVAALLICVLIVSSFTGPFFGLRTGFLLAIILVVALLFLMAGMAYFLNEVRLTAFHLPTEDRQ